MKTTLSLGLFLAALSFAANPQYFGTGVRGTVESNNLTGANVKTYTPVAWYPAVGTSVWESVQADSRSPIISNGTEATFTLKFQNPFQGAVKAYAWVLVDDAAQIVYNNHVLAENRGTALGENCAVSQPNCTSPLMLDLSKYTELGVNTLQITIRQEGLYTFGLDVFGYVTQ